jgi:multidrug efflux pump subunit AcrA (membrane-fusion protein)
MRGTESLQWRGWEGARQAATAFGWRRALLSVAVLGASSFAGLQAYERWAPAAAAPPAVQTASAARRSIVERASLPGTVGAARQARLAFAASSSGSAVSGRVESIAVRTGDVVAAGKELARLNTTSLDLAVESARSALVVAQLKMQQLLAGAVPADVASAQQAVISASSALQKAQSDLATMQGGASAADVASATKAMLDAQSGLVSAQTEFDTLQGRSVLVGQLATAQDDAAKASAERTSALAAFDEALGAIPVKAGAPTNIRSAAMELDAAVSSHCNAAGARDRCAALASEATDLASFVAALGSLTGGATEVAQAFAEFQRSGGTVSVEPLFAALLGYLKGAAILPSLNARVSGLIFAVSAGNGPPTGETLTASQRDRDAASAALTVARSKLDTLLAGATPADLQIARNAVESARASLDAATARRDTLLGGPLPVDIAVQEQTLQQAEVNLRKAMDDRSGAVLVAPFDGVVGTITMNVGETSGTGAIVLIDPQSMQLNATAQESDVGRLKVGQNVNLTFDAYTGSAAVGRVASIAPAADVVQGVPSYAVVIEIVRGQGGRGAPSLDLRSGMAGTAAVEIVRHDNVLAVPSRAVRRQGRSQTVEVMANGTAEMRTVRTGASDGQFTEILEGLNDGDLVIIPTATTTTTGGPQPGAQGQQGRDQGFFVPVGPGGR